MSTRRPRARFSLRSEPTARGWRRHCPTCLRRYHAQARGACYRRPRGAGRAGGGKRARRRAAADRSRPSSIFGRPRSNFFATFRDQAPASPSFRYTFLTGFFPYTTGAHGLAGSAVGLLLLLGPARSRRRASMSASLDLRVGLCRGNRARLVGCSLLLRLGLTLLGDVLADLEASGCSFTLEGQRPFSGVISVASPTGMGSSGMPGAGLTLSGRDLRWPRPPEPTRRALQRPPRSTVAMPCCGASRWRPASPWRRWPGLQVIQHFRPGAAADQGIGQMPAGPHRQDLLAGACAMSTRDAGAGRFSPVPARAGARQRALPAPPAPGSNRPVEASGHPAASLRPAGSAPGRCRMPCGSGSILVNRTNLPVTPWVRAPAQRRVQFPLRSGRPAGPPPGRAASTRLQSRGRASARAAEAQGTSVRRHFCASIGFLGTFGPKTL